MYGRIGIPTRSDIYWTNLVRPLSRICLSVTPLHCQLISRAEEQSQPSTSITTVSGWSLPLEVKRHKQNPPETGSP